jgi:hypothetical protein
MFNAGDVVTVSMRAEHGRRIEAVAAEMVRNPAWFEAWIDHDAFALPGPSRHVGILGEKFGDNRGDLEVFRWHKQIALGRSVNRRSPRTVTDHLRNLGNPGRPDCVSPSF